MFSVNFKMNTRTLLPKVTDGDGHVNAYFINRLAQDMIIVYCRYQGVGEKKTLAGVERFGGM